MPHKVQANDIKITRTLYTKEAHNAVYKQVKNYKQPKVCQTEMF